MFPDVSCLPPDAAAVDCITNISKRGNFTSRYQISFLLCLALFDICEWKRMMITRWSCFRSSHKYLGREPQNEETLHPDQFSSDSHTLWHLWIASGNEWWSPSREESRELRESAMFRFRLTSTSLASPTSGSHWSEKICPFSHISFPLRPDQLSDEFRQSFRGNYFANLK